MTNRFTLGLTRATGLTQSGNLAEATALIQSLLRGDAPVVPPSANPQGELIEGTATPVADLQYTAPQPAGDMPRSGLRETLRRIAAGGMPEQMPLPGMPQPSQPPSQPGARFDTFTHSADAGSRDYKLYVPASAGQTGGEMPLIVMLHGCTQSPDDFAAGTGMNALAEEFGCLVAYPAQPAGANANKCWNWFNPGDQGRDRGEPALIAGVVREILRDHPADPARVYIAGLSAGGAAAIVTGAAYPELFAAVGVHSGLPIGAARDIPSAFAAMRQGGVGRGPGAPIPTITLHGDADATVHPRNGEAVAELARAAFGSLETTVVQGRSAGGRAFRQTRHTAPGGVAMCEHWEIAGAGHAWAGGTQAGSYTDPAGPDASREMLRFFLQHSLKKTRTI